MPHNHPTFLPLCPAMRNFPSGGRAVKKLGSLSGPMDNLGALHLELKKAACSTQSAQAEFFDIRKAWEDSMLRSYKPYDHRAPRHDWRRQQ